ncbi:MAG TPA: NAD(P)H-dependent glycerol-3-phosphate dehydrogenase [Candidatus Methylomirabilis sp.]|nr:NAD(P)H-dependent glycerol-3-phosphate dehydrogenase [Candidatus Methylomirabilis sp.]
MAEGTGSPESVAIVGAGAWGTTLAVVLAERYAHVALWVYEGELASDMQRTRENAVYLPGVPIPSAVQPTVSLDAALAGSQLVIFVVPSHGFRDVLEGARHFLDPAAFAVSATKGIEVQSLSTMSQIMLDVLPPVHHSRLAVISGPSFAREVVAGHPTAIVASAKSAEVAQAIQQAVSAKTLRVYASTDPLGVELAGAVKNVIAIAAGVVDGLGLGLNARAALITRGLAEITRLGVAMGAQASTFAGLAGIGDLILTCTGDLSRNRRVGLALAKGTALADHLGASRDVAEGVNTCRCVVALATRHGVEMPICRAVHRVLFDGQDPRGAVGQLMTRELRFEAE